MATNEAGGSPLAQHTGLIFILREEAGDFAINYSHMIEMRSFLEKALYHFSINTKASL